MNTDKLNAILVSLVSLKNELENAKKIEEAHISWLQVDIQSLVILAEKWEIEFYT